MGDLVRLRLEIDEGRLEKFSQVEARVDMDVSVAENQLLIFPSLRCSRFWFIRH